MKSTPLLLNGAMIRAYQSGRKTQTRRVARLSSNGYVKRGHRYWHPGDPEALLACPFGGPGDELWFRETWAHDAPSLEQLRRELEDVSNNGWSSHGPYFRADEIHVDTGLTWRPSIHMPRWAARYSETIMRVRLERLQEITELDAAHEGIVCGDGEWHVDDCGAKYQRDEFGWYIGTSSIRYNTPRHAFRSLWDSVYAARDHGWSVNPWVWVLEWAPRKAES